MKQISENYFRHGGVGESVTIKVSDVDGARSDFCNIIGVILSGTTKYILLRGHIQEFLLYFFSPIIRRYTAEICKIIRKCIIASLIIYNLSGGREVMSLVVSTYILYGFQFIVYCD